MLQHKSLLEIFESADSNLPPLRLSPQVLIWSSQKGFKPFLGRCLG